MTYNVFGGTLSLTQSINQLTYLLTYWCCLVYVVVNWPEEADRKSDRPRLHGARQGELKAVSLHSLTTVDDNLYSFVSYIVRPTNETFTFAFQSRMTVVRLTSVYCILWCWYMLGSSVTKCRFFLFFLILSTIKHAPLCLWLQLWLILTHFRNFGPFLSSVNVACNHSEIAHVA